RFPVEGFQVQSVAFSPDGKWLAASVTDRTLRIYDLSTGREHEPRLGSSVQPVLQQPEEDVFGLLRNGTGAMRSLAFSPDGSILAAGRDGTEDESSPFSLAAIRLWDVAQGQEIRTIPAHQQWVGSISFSPDGKTIASSGAESVIRFWDVATGREAISQSGHRSYVRSLAVSRADGTVFTGGYDGTVRHWDPVEGRELNVIATINAPVNELALSPDGKTLVLGTAQREGKLGLWSVAERRELIRLPLANARISVRHVAFSPDGKTVASGLRVWDVKSGRVLVQFRHSDAQRVQSAGDLPIFYSPDSSRIITIERDGVYLWDIASGKGIGQVVRAEIPHDPAAMISPDGRLMATGGVFDPSPEKPRDEPIRVWELASGKEVVTLRDHKETTRDLAFSPDGRYLASGGGGHNFTTNDPTVRLWDLATGREVGRFERHRGPVNAVAFSPDGRSLISASDDATAMTWDVSSLQTHVRVEPPSDH
ncbi:WD40 repeat domain-containing protein, partial [Singulisphaera rosea]